MSLRIKWDSNHIQHQGQAWHKTMLLSERVNIKKKKTVSNKNGKDFIYTMLNSNYYRTIFCLCMLNKKYSVKTSHSNVNGTQTFDTNVWMLLQAATPSVLHPSPSLMKTAWSVSPGNNAAAMMAKETITTLVIRLNRRIVMSGTLHYAQSSPMPDKNMYEWIIIYYFPTAARKLKWQTQFGSGKNNFTMQ